MALSKAQYFEAGRRDRKTVPSNKQGHLFGATSWQGRAYTEGYAQGAIDCAKAAESANQTTEVKPMAVMNEMEQEARAMLADSRDYHTLEGAFLLVRDGINVWLCRQRGDSVALDDCERLLCVATEEAKPLTMAEVAPALDRFNSPRPKGMLRYDDKQRWTVEAYDCTLMGIPFEGDLIYNPLRSPDGLRDVSPEHYGFKVYGTGGGCEAYHLELADGRYFLLTDSGGSASPDPDDDGSPMLGIYTADDEAIAAVENFKALPVNGTAETELTELERLHNELRDVHDGEADDDTDFDVWVLDMAANNEGLFQKAALRYIELDKILDYQ
jgi:hypothetical protein